MGVQQRQSDILALLGADGTVEVEALARRFGVTTQTIRQDLRVMDAKGLLRRTHGGAQPVASVTNRSYAQRRLLNGAAKGRIGAAAAALIPDNCSVALNIGTSTEAVARHLDDHQGLMVLSNNINIINRLIGAPAKELVLVGGAVRPSDGAIVGEDAVSFIARYKVDVAVIGASSLDPDGDVLDFDAREVSVARAILENARRRILVADASKFRVTAPVRICDVADLDVVVTDAAVPEPFARAAAEGGTEIVIAGGEDG